MSSVAELEPEPPEPYFLPIRKWNRNPILALDPRCWLRVQFQF